MQRTAARPLIGNVRAPRGKRHARNSIGAVVLHLAVSLDWTPGVVTLREGGDELLTFFRFPKTQWKTLRTTNTVERLHEEFDDA